MRNNDRFRKSFLFVALIVPWILLTYAWFTQSLRPKNDLILPAGTKIIVQVIENIDGTGKKEGGVFNALVAHAVQVQGTVVIPQGNGAHLRVTKSSRQADGGVALYSVQLTDIELGGEMRRVATDARDIPVDVATGSPYPGRATGLIIPENTLLEFTLASPFSAGK